MSQPACNQYNAGEILPERIDGSSRRGESLRNAVFTVYNVYCKQKHKPQNDYLIPNEYVLFFVDNIYESCYLKKKYLTTYAQTVDKIMGAS